MFHRHKYPSELRVAVHPCPDCGAVHNVRKLEDGLLLAINLTVLALVIFAAVSLSYIFYVTIFGDGTL